MKATKNGKLSFNEYLHNFLLPFQIKMKNKCIRLKLCDEKLKNAFCEE
jgi:hypothetical protein